MCHDHVSILTSPDDIRPQACKLAKTRGLSSRCDPGSCTVTNGIRLCWSASKKRHGVIPASPNAFVSENALRVRATAGVLGISRNRLSARRNPKLRRRQLQDLLLASSITINGNALAFQAVSQKKNVSHVVHPGSLRKIGDLGNGIVARLLKRRSSLSRNTNAVVHYVFHEAAWRGVVQGRTGEKMRLHV